jgi:hypothetical protein
VIARVATYASSGESSTIMSQSGTATITPASRIAQRLPAGDGESDDARADTPSVTNVTSAPENES